MFIDSIPESEAGGPLADWYASQRKAWGLLPDYAGCFSSRPDVAHAWASLNLTVRGGMDRRRFELATIAAARAFRSTYGSVAHASFRRDVCNDPDTLQHLVDQPDGSTLDASDAAVYAFATKVATDPSTVEQVDVDALTAAGLSQAEVADIVFAVAARAFFTTVLDGLGARLDPGIAARFDPETLQVMTVGRPVGGEG